MTSIEQHGDVETRSVSATLNYSVPGDRRAIYQNEEPSKSLMFLTPVETPIVDGSSLTPPPALDVEGFTCLDHKVDLTDVAESHDARARYIADMRRLMLEVTGADEVLMVNVAVVRRQAYVWQESDPSEAPAADYVHSDFSLLGFDDVKVLGVPSRPASEIRRTANYNQWRLLSPGPTNRPLALCDASTVAPDDVIPGDSVFPSMDIRFEMAFLRHSPDHRWIYFPRLTDDQVLVFKQADSDPSQVRLTPHTAFDDASCPPGAAPRISVETRSVAIWYG